MPDMSKYVSPKVPLSVGDPSPRGFLGPRIHIPNGILIGLVALLGS